MTWKSSWRRMWWRDPWWRRKRELGSPTWSSHIKSGMGRQREKTTGSRSEPLNEFVYQTNEPIPTPAELRHKLQWMIKTYSLLLQITNLTKLFSHNILHQIQPSSFSKLWQDRPSSLNYPVLSLTSATQFSCIRPRFDYKIEVQEPMVGIDWPKLHQQPWRGWKARQA